MRKTIIIIGIILGFLLINIFSINSYYNNFKGEKSYENKNFSGALNIFKNEKDYIGLYNLGNTNYRLGEQEKEDNKKIEYWEKSVDFYKNSLKLKYNTRTEYNYNFVLNKLKKLKKKQEEEKKKQDEKNNKNQKSGEEKNQDNKQNSGDGNNKNGKNLNKQNKSGEKSNKENGKQLDKKENFKKGKNGKQNDSKKGDIQNGNKQNSGDNKGKSEPKLSKKAKQQIKAYEEKLKQEQKKNTGNFGKVYREESDPFDDFDEFFNNQFFDNSILEKSEKKDW